MLLSSKNECGKKKFFQNIILGENLMNSLGWKIETPVGSLIANSI